ncbi:hypothetical protein MTR67_040172 [Solanum verrucosum]|uniref:Uncharacterized protein n=1 Tax=Solanum verrucosum TaxID=315347 RepID=A0AAF0ZP77_SOLVR|nr:hypothetical protein MTR67_040172 [Solanum verrucosum]
MRRGLQARSTETKKTGPLCRAQILCSYCWILQEITATTNNSRTTPVPVAVTEIQDMGGGGGGKLSQIYRNNSSATNPRASCRKEGMEEALFRQHDGFQRYDTQLCSSDDHKWCPIY